jgi:hypothetical protein
LLHNLNFWNKEKRYKFILEYKIIKRFSIFAF